MKIKKIYFLNSNETETETILFFAEHSWQVDDLKKLSISTESKWIATGPSAMHRLLKLRIKYDTPDDYCCEREVEDLCVSHFNRLAGVCNELDKAMIEQNPALKEWGIRPFFFHLWQLGALSDGLLGRAVQINKIVDNFPNSVVYAHMDKLADWQEGDLSFQKNDTLWGNLLVAKGVGAGSTIESLTVGVTQNADSKMGNNNGPLLFEVINKVKRLALGLFRKNIVLYSLYKKCRDRLFEKSRKGGAGILVVRESEWMCVVKKLLDRGYNFYFLSDVYKNKISRPKSVSGRSEKLWTIFISDFDPIYRGQIGLLRERFDYIAEESLLISLEIIAKLKKILSGKGIKIILSACGLSLLDYLISCFAKKNNIPTISYQHGALWYENRINQRMDLFDLVGHDYLLTYGDRPKKAYETSPFMRQENCEVISVGMPSLDDLNKIGKDKNENKKTLKILWPFGGYYGNNWYCGFSPPRNDRIYYKNQLAIIDRLLSMINKESLERLTIKLYPDCHSYQPPWVSDIKNLKQIKMIYDDPSFADLLEMHDFVIIDSPTTTLLQSIATALPVFVLTSVVSPPKADLSILEKRAVCAGDSQALMDKVEEFIITGKYPADANNKEYLKLYGTYLNDGNSAGRAVAILENIIDSQGVKNRIKHDQMQPSGVSI